MAVATLPRTEHQLVAVAARDAGRAAHFAKRHGIPKSYGNYQGIANDKNVGEMLFFLYIFGALMLTIRLGKD